MTLEVLCARDGGLASRPTPPLLYILGDMCIIRDELGTT